jgi:glycosyltransferase involved in cell wall biosynthesis
VHVLIIPSWYPLVSGDIGGSFFREQAHALARVGCKVGVISPQLRSLRQWRSILTGKYGVTIEDDDGVITLRHHDMGWFPRMPRMQAMQWVTRGRRLYADYVERCGRPDVIHAHSLLYGGCVARDLSEREGIPYVVTEHSSAFVRRSVTAWQRRIAGASAANARRRFAVSETFCRFLGEYFGTDVTEWSYVPNSVRDSFLMASLKPQQPRREFSFLHVSLLDANKAVDLLIRAYAKAFGGSDEVVLKIGGGGDREKLEALAADLGVARQVQFLGVLTRDDVVRQLQACDAFVLSSRYETFGVVLIEAMALGRPVVATRCGGPESIVRVQDGLLVPVDDVAQLAEAMQVMKLRYDDYDPEKIRASCAERFSGKSVTDRLIAEYRAVCKQSLLGMAE